jgi:hypothetical protein
MWHKIAWRTSVFKFRDTFTTRTDSVFEMYDYTLIEELLPYNTELDIIS